MVINYFSSGCFRLQSGETSLLVDPVNNRLKGDVVLKTLSSPEWQASSPNEIGFPGEYEIKGISVRGWPVDAESTEKFLKTVYLVDWEEMRFVFLGHLSKPLADENILEEIAEADVLFIPAGQEHFLKVDEAVKLAKKIEPAIVIPSFYKNAGELAKAFGQKAESQEKFVFKKKDLSDLKGRVVVLRAE